MQEFMKQNMNHLHTQQQTQTGSDGNTPPEEVKLTPSDFKFEYKPKDVKAHLDRFVIRQDAAKRVLSVALCDHYHYVKRCLETDEELPYVKQNILLAGPTGVGKTYLIKSMAELIGVPFVKADATKFSETGYVGADVEDLVRDLVRQANGDAKRAEFGIIYIDEIDKIASPSDGSPGRDVSGRGVQTNLLKLMEETDVPARSANDLAGQIQGMMEGAQRGGQSKPTISTKHILFVVSGAFDGLDKIVRKRTKEGSIGFASPSDHETDSSQLLDLSQTRDFIQYGFEPEFIGRLPVRVVCHPLSEDDLFFILKASEGSIIKQYESAFESYGIEALFKDSGLREIARQADGEGTGARGLMTVCERVFRDLKFELPSSSVRQIVADSSLVQDPATHLQRLLDNQDEATLEELIHFIEEYCDLFLENHALNIRFSSEAKQFLAKESQAKETPIRLLLSDRFKDLQFGLKLVSKNTGRSDFELDVEAARDPDQALSKWVVESYRSDNSAKET